MCHAKCTWLWSGELGPKAAPESPGIKLTMNRKGSMTRLIRTGSSGTRHFRALPLKYECCLRPIQVRTFGMPSAKGGARHGRQGGCAEESAAVFAGANDDVHRLEVCIGWIYEFFSRHRMDQAQAGACIPRTCKRTRSSPLYILWCAACLPHRTL